MKMLVAIAALSAILFSVGARAFAGMQEDSPPPQVAPSGNDQLDDRDFRQ